MGVEVRVDAGLLEAVERTSGACGVVLVGGGSAALREGRRALLAVRHPDEPEDGFVSYASAVRETPLGPAFWFDAADAQAYDGLAGTLVEALRIGVASVVTGDCELSTCAVDDIALPRRAPGPPAFALPPGLPLPGDLGGIEVSGTTRRGSISGWSPQPARAVLAFFEAELAQAGYDIERGFSMSLGSRPVTWEFEGFIVHHEGVPGVFAVGTPFVDTARWPNAAAELEALGRSRVEISIGPDVPVNEFP